MKPLCRSILLILLTGCGKPNGQSEAPNGRLEAQMSSEQATLIARQLANQRSQALYHCEPFDGAGSAQWLNGRWAWHERRAYYSGDIEAMVLLGPDGSAQSVQVTLLVDRMILSIPKTDSPKFT